MIAAFTTLRLELEYRHRLSIMSRIWIGIWTSPLTYSLGTRSKSSSKSSGATVEHGQVIGYVGATGLATGPHLHFALFRDGKYINPLTTKLPIEEADTRQRWRAEVIELRRRLAEQLAALKVDHTAVSLALPASQNLSTIFRKTSEPEGQRHFALTDPHTARVNRRQFLKNSEG